MVEGVSMSGAKWGTAKDVLVFARRDPHQLLQCKIGRWASGDSKQQCQVDQSCARRGLKMHGGTKRYRNSDSVTRET